MVVKGSFQGVAGLLNFILIQRPGLAQQNKQGKTPPSPALSGTFWRLNVATPHWQVSKIETLQFHHFFFGLQQTHTETFISLKQSENYS